MANSLRDLLNLDTPKKSDVLADFEYCTIFVRNPLKQRNYDRFQIVYYNSIQSKSSASRLYCIDPSRPRRPDRKLNVYNLRFEDPFLVKGMHHTEPDAFYKIDLRSSTRFSSSTPNL